MKILRVHPLKDGRFEVRDGREVLGASQNEMMAIWTAVSVAQEMTGSGLYARVVRVVRGEELEEWPNPLLKDNVASSDFDEHDFSEFPGGETTPLAQIALPGVSGAVVATANPPLACPSDTRQHPLWDSHLLSRSRIESLALIFQTLGKVLTGYCEIVQTWMATLPKPGIIGLKLSRCAIWRRGKITPTPENS